ncbi:MAG TPA: glycosyltransferase family 4 protein [Candidatus Angelobacter sp.]|jgi:glycosyltransferase involved in cell wall biosynthesis|nr:glycosyltransferase family 4 protein [Candidatus Angelobacter sp.]
MHILITADTLGGVWTYTRELVTGLVRGGDRVTLVSFGDIPTAAQTKWMEGLADLDYRPTAFKLEWMLDSEADMAASSQYLQAVVRETKPDLLHFSQYYYGALQCDLPRIVVAHSDVISWWTSVHGKTPPETEWLRWYREVVARGLSEASTVVAPSRWMLEQIDLHYGALHSTSVVHNGRTAALFNPHMSKEENIVTVGRLWDGGKNVALLLRQELPLPVHIVGSNRHPEFESPSLTAEGIPSHVHLEAEQDERQIVQTLARAGIYAATSQYEPFGLAPVEAALSRCAIVASDIPTFRELWDGAAIFFRGNDSVSLCQAVESLQRDPALRRSLGNLAYQHARQHFPAERMVAGYKNLYQKLLPAGAISA